MSRANFQDSSTKEVHWIQEILSYEMKNLAVLLLNHEMHVTFLWFASLLTACRVQYCICKKYRALYHFITEVHYVIQLAKNLKLETHLNCFGSFYFSSKSISKALEKGLVVKDYYDLWSIKRPTFLKYDFTSGQNQYSINDQQRYFYLTWFSRTSKTFTAK